MIPSQPNQPFAAERPIRSDFARQQRGLPYAARRFMTLAVLAVIMAAGGVWGWGRFSTSTPGEIPTVKADGPIKQRPDQPGGVDIPNQDVQVYRAIDSEPSGLDKPVAEHMLPPPEVPHIDESATANNPTFVQNADVSSAAQKIEEIKPPESMSAKIDPLIDRPPVSIPTTVMNRTPRPAGAPQAEAVVAAPPPTIQATVSPSAPVVASPSSPAVAPQPAPVVSSQPEPRAVPQPAPVQAPLIAATRATAAAPLTKTGTIIQLAATPDAEAADVLVKKLQMKYATILGGAHLHSVRADLGSKGVFYRIQSQPLAAADAGAICVAVKQQHAGCLLVRP